MFKKSQVWQGTRNKEHIILVKRVHETMPLVDVEFIDGPRKGHKGWIYTDTVEVECTLIGNNYQEKSPAPLPDDGGEAVAMPRETHNLIQNLRRDNKELRRQNKDLRDDIGDMASKLHLAYRDKFPGIAALWPTPEALPEQRGCRKEDC